jgi:hypothetical protein
MRIKTNRTSFYAEIVIVADITTRNTKREDMQFDNTEQREPHLNK